MARPMPELAPVINTFFIVDSSPRDGVRLSRLAQSFSSKMNKIEISRRQLALSRLHTIVVGTLTAIGEFAYSLIWGRQQARFIRKLLG